MYNISYIIHIICGAGLLVDLRAKAHLLHQALAPQTRCVAVSTKRPKLGLLAPGSPIINALQSAFFAGLQPPGTAAGPPPTPLE